MTIRYRLINIKLVILCAFLLVGFASKEHEGQPESFEQAVQQANPEQLDMMMTVWFDAFKQYQKEGKTMYKSDQLARQQVLLEISTK